MGRRASSTDLAPRAARGVCPRLASALVAALTVAGPAVLHAEPWRVTASASARLTYTDNVDFGPSGDRQSDFVTSLVGTIGVTGGSPRLRLNGSLALTETIDARGHHSGSIAPVGALGGTYEAIDNFAFVDFSAALQQTYLSPFGPQPQDLVNTTTNRYTSQSYTVSPYIRGVLPGNVSYVVRDQNTWTTATTSGDSAATPPNTYSNALTASASSAAGRVGWKVDYARSFYDSGGDVPTSLTQSIRAELPVRIDPELVVGPVVGYERNRFGDQQVQSTIYGIVGQWRPTDRTNLSGRWEHRFFGSGYSLEASHRLPRVALSLSLARDVSTYPQRAQAFAAGASLASYVDEAFRTRIPDAGARALAVEQFLARSGLPATLLAPIDIFGTSFQLQTSARLSAALLGGRNSLGLSVFHVRSSALSATDQTPLSEVLPPSLAFASNSTQVGASVVYGYQLSGFTNFSASAAVSRVTAGDERPANAIDRAINANFAVSIDTKLGVNTSGSVGVGYSRFLPQGGSDSSGSSATNVFASVSHTFR